MPIYAYRCGSCGHAKDVLQKLSDPVLSTCPACGAEAFSKQVTAAGFQLKGSGWYATDFKGGGAAPAAPAKADDAGASKTGGDAPAAGGGSGGGAGGGDAAASGSSASASAGGACGGSCACH